MAGFKGGMGGVGNMQNLMKQAQKMQEQMQETEKELEDYEVVGLSGGGEEGDETVVVYMNAKKIINGIEFGSKLSETIDITDEDDIEMLEDLWRQSTTATKRPTKCITRRWGRSAKRADCYNAYLRRITSLRSVFARSHTYFVCSLANTRAPRSARISVF